ncbi:hypothetical protein IFM89_039365 [Coptis chinensis]|uniref:Uncharacterized protein n=1 Tax=Coptis chinensis TaxID=261450 RepID=A0A835I888_9MAGN|nr:hypothetical protein IFM89_039365 [Coptis chinensis]
MGFLAYILVQTEPLGLPLTRQCTQLVLVVDTGFYNKGITRLRASGTIRPARRPRSHDLSLLKIIERSGVEEQLLLLKTHFLRPGISNRRSVESTGLTRCCGPNRDWYKVLPSGLPSHEIDADNIYISLEDGVPYGASPEIVFSGRLNQCNRDPMSMWMR